MRDDTPLPTTDSDVAAEAAAAAENEMIINMEEHNNSIATNGDKLDQEGHTTTSKPEVEEKNNASDSEKSLENETQDHATEVSNKETVPLTPPDKNVSTSMMNQQEQTTTSESPTTNPTKQDLPGPPEEPSSVGPHPLTLKDDNASTMNYEGQNDNEMLTTKESSPEKELASNNLHPYSNCLRVTTTSLASALEDKEKGLSSTPTTEPPSPVQDDDEEQLPEAKNFVNDEKRLSIPPIRSNSEENGNHHNDSSNGNNNKSFTATWIRLIFALHAKVVWCLQHLATVGVKYPRGTLIGLSCLSVGLVAAGYFTNFTVETETYKLWPPTSSQSVNDLEWLHDESHFNYNPVEMDLLIHADGQNVLGQEGVARVFEVMDTVREIDGYADGCAYAEMFGDYYSVGQCHITSVADFWNESLAVFEEKVHNDTDAIRYLSQTYYPNGIRANTDQIMGNVQRDPDTGLLTHAESFGIRFAIPWSNVTLDFEEDALQKVLDLQRDWKRDMDNMYRLEVYSRSSYNNEFFRAIVADLWLLPVAFLIVAVFTVGFAFGKRDKVQSRGLLGIGAVVTIVASVMTTFGIMFIIGIPFTTQTLMVPFLMFGIGLDDAFIIYGSYHRTNHKAPIAERIHTVMADVGVSIFLTSMTSMLAFLLGSFSTIPAVQWLCLYSFPAIGIDFVYQITFFVAMIALDEQRIQANRMDYCPCVVVPHRHDDEVVAPATVSGASPIESVDCANKTTTSTTNVNETPSEIPHSQTEPTLVDPGFILEQGDTSDDCESTGGSHDSDRHAEDDQEKHIADQIMTWWSIQLLKRPVQIASMVLFAMLTAGSIYCATQLEQQFDFTDLVPDDSYVKGFFNARSVFASIKGTYGVHAYFRFENQSDPEVWEDMEAYIEDLVQYGNVEDPIYFWLRDFRAYAAEQLEEEERLIGSHDVNKTLVAYFDEDNQGEELFSSMSFDEQVNQFLSVPIYKDLYKDHIGRNWDNEVLESRCPINIVVSIQSSKETTAMLSNVREISGSQPINEDTDDWSFFTYSNSYHLYEFYRRVVEELIFTTMMGIIAVNVIALVFIPHPTAVLYVFPFIAILYVNMLGWLYLTGINVNAVSYVTLVMSIGLMIDYIMHILMRYYESKGNRRQRIQDTMGSMGASIFLGAASTFLGLLALSLSTSAVLRNIFTSVIGLITFGVLDGLIFLPVVLSLIGPES